MNVAITLRLIREPIGGYILASYFASLRIALKSLQERDPNIIALGVDRYIPPLKDDESISTKEEIAKHLSGYARFETQPNDQQLEILVQVVALAKAGSSTANKPAPVPKDSNERPSLPSDVPVPDVTATDEPSVLEPAEPEVGSLDPVPMPEPVVNYDLSSFTGYSPMADRSEVIAVENVGQGLQVSWKGVTDGSKIYLVSASNSALPQAPSGAGTKVVTTTNSLLLDNYYRFVTVFEFSAPNTKGSVFGSVETVGSVLEFEGEEFASEVRLRWQTDDTGAQVLIARSESNALLPDEIPASLIQYQALASSGNTYVDAGVSPGDKFVYRIWLQRTSSGRVGKSAPKELIVSIPGRIPAIEDFQVSISEKGPGFVNISFKALPEKNAKVHIYQVQGAPSGDLMSAIAEAKIAPRNKEELKLPRVQAFLGSKIIADQPRPIDGIIAYKDVPLPTEEIGSRTFIPVIELGDHFIIGDTQVINQIGNVTSAELVDRFDYQLLRVELPSGASFIEVWHQGPGTSWDSVAGTPPSRTVNIDQEYRPNGGILFAKPNPTMRPGVSELGVDPARLFIRGASIFAGQPHGSPEIYQLDYPGRLEVHVRFVAVASGRGSSPRRGLFSRQSTTVTSAPVSYTVQFKVVTPTGLVGQVALHHLQTKIENGLPISLQNHVIGKVNLDFQKFKDWASYPTGEDGISGPPLTVTPEFAARFVPINEKFGNIPVFVVDERISEEQAKLPPAAAKDATYKVIFIGAKRSGKTTYVQAFLHNLERQFAHRFGSHLVANPESIAAKSRLDSLHAFLESGQLPPSTPSARQFAAGTQQQEDDPRASIQFDLIGGAPPFRSVEIVDVAGEDMDKLDDIRLYTDQLATADLIVYLFDPLQQPSVADVLQGKIAIPARGTDPFEVLVNVSTVLNEAPNRNPNQKVAIAVSKFDGLVEASNLDIEHPFRGTITNGMSVTRDPNAWDNKCLNQTDSWQVHKEVKALLMRETSLNPFVTEVKNRFGPENTRFFVVSALGHSTFANQINRAGITSFRVTDPILWLVS